MLVTINAEILEIGKEIGRYKIVTGAKINREKSVGLRLDRWKGKKLAIFFGLDLQLQKNSTSVLEKVIAATNL